MPSEWPNQLSRLVVQHFGGETGDGIALWRNQIACDQVRAAEAALVVADGYCSGLWLGGIRDVAADRVAAHGADPYGEDASLMLADEVLQRADQLANMLAPAWTPGDALCARAGILRWDAQLIEVLGRIGHHGQLYSAKVGEASSARAAQVLAGGNAARLWRAWADPTRLSRPRWLEILADAVWLDQVRPYLENKRSYYPAIARDVPDRFMRAQRARVTRAMPTPLGYEALAANGVVVARFAAIEQSNLEAIQRGALVMRKPLAEQVIRTLVLDAHDQRARGVEPHIRLVYSGGIEALAARAGIKKQGASAEIRDLLEALQSFRGARLDAPDMLMARLLGSSPGRKAELIVTLGTALAPGYAQELKRAKKRHGEAWLLPVLPIPSLPTVDKRSLANLYSLQWQILVEMRGALGELDHGWVLAKITATAADRSEVDRRTANKAVEHWLNAPDAWLRPTTPGRVTLAEEGALNLWRAARAKAGATSERAIRVHYAKKR